MLVTFQLTHYNGLITHCLVRIIKKIQWTLVLARYVGQFSRYSRKTALYTNMDEGTTRVQVLAHCRFQNRFSLSWGQQLVRQRRLSIQQLHWQEDGCTNQATTLHQLTSLLSVTSLHRLITTDHSHTLNGLAPSNASRKLLDQPVPLC